ncbi:hypothetical protein BO94DRAFT_14468 [Aspergillus sclerotioniger CBS 115572]|uniref:Uncharacterized protein n=1 Tax=Aspergillus sclerotioniger CBS 115572 TaxID=1450535 RepID=A0A317XEE2_9EURO|nr:hypothetical protein BO94DRAFT_14468 [Aspergillus sclerotioniger CBS 115572]PWY96561.1 hypothetical protein BO94DRAFT_14468 [Aspergillus sclerotioniger CBS 115572]
MPPVATPFRASRRNAGPQFASTPRFFLSQTPASSRPSQDVESIDHDDFEYATPVPTARTSKRLREHVPTPRQREIIEDSEAEPDEDATPPLHSKEGILDEEPQSSSPGEPGELDAVFEEIFGSTRNRTKRRLVSWTNSNDDTSSILRSKPRADAIATSSPDPPPPPLADNLTPSASYHTPNKALPEQRFRKPVRSAPEIQQPTTPASIMPSPLQPRRFVLSASQLPPSSQTQSGIRPPNSTATTPIPLSQRRTPAFVLPRSPSPTHEEDDLTGIPTPFSPSSRALRHRGGRRSAAPNYVPGGMAAEVRSWILEMGAKREQQQTSPSYYQRTDSSSPDTRKYSVTVRINSAHQTALRSCGSLAFVQGHPVDTLGVSSGPVTYDESQLKNVLLLGPPRQPTHQTRHATIRIPELKLGDTIGVCRGLAWEVDLGEHQNAQVSGTDLRLDDLSPLDRSYLQTAGKWHVGMEWELIS